MHFVRTKRYSGNKNKPWILASHPCLPPYNCMNCENYFISPCHNFSVKDLFCKREGCVPVIYYCGTNDHKS